jgi:hypothetical protein
MLEDFDLDDLGNRRLAERVARPAFLAVRHGGYFYCPACHISFEFGVDPVPQGPCEPLPTEAETLASSPAPSQRIADG